jgi:hypothetical protein
LINGKTEVTYGEKDQDRYEKEGRKPQSRSASRKSKNEKTENPQRR